MTAIRKADEGVATLAQPNLEGPGHALPAGVDALWWQLATPQERQVLLQALASVQAQAAPLFTRDGQGLALVRALPSWLDAPARVAVSCGAASGVHARCGRASLDAAVLGFQNRFATAASDHARFSAMMRESFGGCIDASRLEALREQSLAGDFSWMPQIRLADTATLRDVTGAHGDVRGAYAQAQDTVYLNRDLLKDPAMAEQVLGEEVGHAIDARINTTDAAGDEGHLFTELLHGQAVDAQEFQALRDEDDHGAIQVGGRREEVEFDDGGGDSGSGSSSESSAGSSEGSGESAGAGESSTSEGSESASTEGAEGGASGAEGEGAGNSEGMDGDSGTSDTTTDSSYTGDDGSAATDSLSGLATPNLTVSKK